jgi:hypothetical protein
MTNADGQEFVGRANRAEGKATTIQLQRGTLSGTIKRVRIMGREEFTASERARDEFILLVLRGERTLDDSLFIRLLWFPPLPNLPKTSNESAISTRYISKGLNDSQHGVIGAMLDVQIPLVIAHGQFDLHHIGRHSNTHSEYRSTWNWKDLDYIRGGQNLE